MTRRPPSPRTAKRAPGRRRTRARRRPSAVQPSQGDAGPGSGHHSPLQLGRMRRAAPYELDISARQDHVRVDKAYVRRVTQTVLADEQVAAARISVALADNTTVRRVNRDFFGHDYDTDVISFVFESTPEFASPRTKSRKMAKKVARPRGAGLSIDGEVLVSAEMAAEMAGRFGWSALDELTLYLVHGLLHLCGYDDLSTAERRVMRQRERDVLALLGIVARPRSGRGQHHAAAARSARNGSPS